MDQTHQLEDTVVAVIPDRETADQAARALAAAGYDAEVLEGEAGTEHLDPSGESSPAATIKRLLNAFGDQYRILDALTDELEAGNLVISVDSTPDEAEEAVWILQDHGARFMWKLGKWTYTQIGE